MTTNRQIRNMHVQLDYIERSASEPHDNDLQHTGSYSYIRGGPKNVES